MTCHGIALLMCGLKMLWALDSQAHVSQEAEAGNGAGRRTCHLAPLHGGAASSSSSKASTLMQRLRGLGSRRATECSSRCSVCCGSCADMGVSREFALGMLRTLWKSRSIATYNKSISQAAFDTIYNG